MKVNNPYTEILGVMQRQGSKSNPPTIQIGTVLSPAPHVVVRLGDLQLDNDNLYAFDGYQALAAGDTVAVLAAADRQKYIILCKVVGLGG